MKKGWYIEGIWNDSPNFGEEFAISVEDGVDYRDVEYCIDHASLLFYACYDSDGRLVRQIPVVDKASARGYCLVSNWIFRTRTEREGT